MSERALVVRWNLMMIDVLHNIYVYLVSNKIKVYLAPGWLRMIHLVRALSAHCPIAGSQRGDEDSLPFVFFVWRSTLLTLDKLWRCWRRFVFTGSGLHKVSCLPSTPLWYLGIALYWWYGRSSLTWWNCCSSLPGTLRKHSTLSFLSWLQPSSLALCAGPASLLLLPPTFFATWSLWT